MSEQSRTKYINQEINFDPNTHDHVVPVCIKGYMLFITIWRESWTQTNFLCKNIAKSSTYYLLGVALYQNIL